MIKSVPKGIALFCCILRGVGMMTKDKLELAKSLINSIDIEKLEDISVEQRADRYGSSYIEISVEQRENKI